MKRLGLSLLLLASSVSGAAEFKVYGTHLCENPNYGFSCGPINGIYTANNCEEAYEILKGNDCCYVQDGVTKRFAKHSCTQLPAR
jgi:hypothetical protein